MPQGVQPNVMTEQGGGGSGNALKDTIGMIGDAAAMVPGFPAPIGAAIGLMAGRDPMQAIAGLVPGLAQMGGPGGVPATNPFTGIPDTSPAPGIPGQVMAMAGGGGAPMSLNPAMMGAPDPMGGPMNPFEA